MEKIRNLGNTISNNYGSVLEFCRRYGYNTKDINYLIGADRIDAELKKEVFANAKKKDEFSITEAERVTWMKMIQDRGGFSPVARAIGEQVQYLRMAVFSRRFKDNRLINAIKEINDLSL